MLILPRMLELAGVALVIALMLVPLDTVSTVDPETPFSEGSTSARDARRIVREAANHRASLLQNGIVMITKLIGAGVSILRYGG